MKPERAVERSLEERKHEVSASTHQNHTYALGRFLEWCDHEELGEVGELDGFHLHDFKIHRREHGGVKEVTLYTNLCALRMFVRWCESMELISDRMDVSARTLD